MWIRNNNLKIYISLHNTTLKRCQGNNTNEYIKLGLPVDIIIIMHQITIVSGVLFVQNFKMLYVVKIYMVKQVIQ